MTNPPPEHRAGESAPVVHRHRWLPAREEIGAPECPLLHRWTIFKRLGVKMQVHHFLPNSTDTDCHDHPRSFVTFILRGRYLDERPDGTSELMRPGMVRLRRAEHAHRTTAGPRGCWTFVVTGPLRREWGFWRDGRWFEWRAYERRFGLAMRCDDTGGTDD